MLLADNRIKVKLYQYLKELLTLEKLDKIEKLAPLRSRFILPVIEDVYQFRNAGAIVRSMESFGFQSLYALENRNTFIPSHEVSKGADKWIDIHYLPCGIESLQKIRELGYVLTAVSPEKDAQNINELDLLKPRALIFGTEFHGISKETLEVADEFVKIPMNGFTESLNISVAAGICFYLFRQRLESLPNNNWKLTENEILNIKVQWAINSISSGKEIANHFIKKII